MLILILGGRWGFRGIGNTFFKYLFSSESWADSRLGQRFIQVLLRIVLGHTVRSNSIEEFPIPWICWRLVVARIFRLEFQVDGINERKAWTAPVCCGWCLGSFSPDDVLDSCVIRRNETNLEKARCLYLCSHESPWLNWKATRRGCDQVKHVPQGFTDQ